MECVQKQKPWFGEPLFWIPTFWKYGPKQLTYSFCNDKAQNNKNLLIGSVYT